MSFLTSPPTIIPCRASMRIVFLRWFMNALQPAPQEQRPKKHRAGDNDHPKTPAAVRGVRIHLPHADQHERDGESQTARQIDSRRKQ
jgi:hypothetical protein